MNSPKTSFNETDLSQGVRDIPAALNGILVRTLRGPINDVANNIVTSPEQFQKRFGGIVVGQQGAAQALRALQRGSALRVQRMLHYTNPADKTTYDATFPLMANMYKVVLAGALGVGHSIVVTKGATVITQAYITSGLATLQALAVQLLAQAWIADVKVIDATHINIAGATVTAIVTSTTGAGAPAITSQVAYNTVVDTTGANVFGLTQKNPGIDGNSFKIAITAGTNGRSDSFNIVIVHLTDATLNESYENIRIPGKPTVQQSAYLNRITQNTDSNFNVVYYDLSAFGGAFVVPDTNLVLGFQGGTDGTVPIAADYIGDPAGKTGFYAFDGVDDISAIAVLDDVSGMVGVHEGGSSYAANRKDIKYFFHLGAQNSSEQAVANLRNALNIDSSYARCFAGGISWVNTKTGLQEWMSELGDILGVAAYSEEHYGAYKSFAGKNRGIINNVIGSGNAWGARGNYANLNILAQAQVNVVIDRDKKTYLLSNLTTQIDTSQLSFGNVRDLVIFIKKSLFPTIEKYQEEGCEPTAWKKMYLEVKPFLDGLVTKKALFDYRWAGDQYAKSINQGDLQVNTTANVNLGKYKARLFIWSVVAMQEIAIDVVITSSSVSFEDVINLVQP
jgi:hypothetical protein